MISFEIKRSCSIPKSALRMINIVTPEFIPGEGGSHYGESAVGTIRKGRVSTFLRMIKSKPPKSQEYGPYLTALTCSGSLGHPRDESLGYKIGRSYVA